ncbi:hypothetical protein [Streptomyces sp. NPDC058953]|uniref:hypothetical protein n=1 Tax=unclassified Streptomyces TaxID=2593676 RepID=UPI0036CBB065
MKVKFRGVEGLDRRVRQGAAMLRGGIEYIVLEIFCQADGVNYFRVEFSDEEIPPLFDSRLFDLVDADHPACWGLQLEPDGSLTWGPPAWNAPGFWDALMEHEDVARRIYREERSRIMASPGHGSG